LFWTIQYQKKAKTFAGDVGSISMALFLGYFMIKTILETGQLGYFFFSVYGIDAVITIFIRLKTKKTFSNHIVHIYISIQMKLAHVLVSFIYAEFNF
jgi:UDP-N-acetylmuramyl pentapeptide phosphotransferase/UDP-N-acetylglucosamine-1-phosphate transferase